MLQLTPDSAEVVGEAPASYVYVDGNNVGGVDHTVLRDRQHLANDGLVVIVVAVDHQTGLVVGDVDIVARGFAELDKSSDLRGRAVEAVYDAIGREKHAVEWNDLHDLVKDEVSKLLYRETRQRPMVLPVAVEV